MISLSPARSSRSWVNSGEESALPMVSSLISVSCKYEVSCRWLTPGWKFRGVWEVVVVEEVGLVTCEGRYWPKGQTPHWAKCTGDLAPATSTWKRKGGSQSSGGWSGRWERQMKSAKRGSKRDQTHNQAHNTWMRWRAQTLEPMSCETSLHISESCETQPNCGTIFTIATAFLSSLSLRCGNSSHSLAFYLVVRQPYDAGTNTYPQHCIPFLFCKIDIR